MILWITVAASALGALAFVNRVSVINDMLDAEGFADLLRLRDRANDADDFAGGAALVMALLSLTIFVLLVIWLWRVAKNAEQLGRTGPRFGPGWTIGGWFIPIANLVIPVLVVQDLWRGSDPATPRGDPLWRRASGSTLVGFWWAFHVLALMRFAAGDEADTRVELEDLRTNDTIAAIGMVLAVVAAILLIQVVRRLAQRQETLAGEAGVSVR